MSSFLEIVMLLCFGTAWPIAIHKSWTMRRTTGKSLPFLIVILVGYSTGIVNKLVYHPDFVVWFYALNWTMVVIDISLWLRNRRLERMPGAAAAPATAAPKTVESATSGGRR